MRPIVLDIRVGSRPVWVLEVVALRVAHAAGCPEPPGIEPGIRGAVVKMIVVKIKIHVRVGNGLKLLFETCKYLIFKSLKRCSNLFDPRPSVLSL
jgi:hypothetical protein